MQLADYFDAAYYINLAYRTDRRAEVERELQRARISATRFEAIRPDSAGEFPTLGTHGCFMSHLGVLKQAYEEGHDRVIIFEDDLLLRPALVEQQAEVVEQLQKHADWDFVFFGHDLEQNGHPTAVAARGKPWRIEKIQADFGLLHCYAVRRTILPQLIEYLETILTRKAGDPRGGPMHVDGAYTHFRNDHPEVQTLVALPQIAVQRSSRTDIHELSLKDRVPLLRDAVAIARRLRNRLRGR